MTLRSIMVMVAMVAGSLAALADREDPMQWSVVRQWTAAVFPTPTSYLIHRQRPAWNSTEPVLVMTDHDGKVAASGFIAEDIRAVSKWRDKFIAVRVIPGGADIVVLNASLQVEALTKINQEPLTIDHEAIVSVHSRDDVPWVFVRLNGTVVAIEPLNRPLQPKVIEDGVNGIAMLRDRRYCLAIVHDVGGIAYVSILDQQLSRRIAPSVPLASWSRIEEVDSHVVVLSPIDKEQGLHVTTIDMRTSEVLSVPIDASVDLADVMKTPNGLSLAALITRNGRLEITITPMSVVGDGLAEGVVVPGEYGTPLAVRCLGDTVLLMCSGGVITIADGTVLSRDPIALDLEPRTLALYRIDNGILISSMGGSTALRAIDQPYALLFTFLNTIGAYVTTIVLLLVIIVLWYRNRSLRRFLDAMIEIPGAGLVFALDAAGRLRRTNEQAARLLRISKKVPMNRVFHSYLRFKGLDQVRQFLDQALTDRVPLSEKVSIDDGDEQREYVFTATPLFGSFGKLRGVVITGVDITEALERRRLVNWAQLAHDMQTNLSTIRLNAEQLAHEESSINRERVKRIMFQTQVLMQRVRDLVSVGRSEVLTRAPVHSAEFCTQIRHEFDPEMFPHATFVMKLRGCMMNVDRLKLSRAVRNAVENAIKALRGQPGTIEIATWFDREHVFFRVSDTGVGMDTLTLEHMMKPYFTTAKDGSGTGIGTMIMQHVTHLHGGSLRVTSEPGVGTQVVFIIPHQMDNVRAMSRSGQMEDQPA